MMENLYLAYQWIAGAGEIALLAWAFVAGVRVMWGERYWRRK